MLATILMMLTAEPASKPLLPDKPFYYCPSPAEKLAFMRQGYKVEGCKITPRPKSSLPALRKKAK